MQYILSEAEYAELKAGAQVERADLRGDLQYLCMQVAIHMPVKRSWLESDVNQKPWGCILDKASDPGYCDECPVKKLCPHKGKRFSQ
jgi:hypothetical protein